VIADESVADVEGEHGVGDGPDNASPLVTVLTPGTVTRRVLGPFAPVPATDRSSRAAVGAR